MSEQRGKPDGDETTGSPDAAPVDPASSFSSDDSTAPSTAADNTSLQTLDPTPADESPSHVEVAPESLHALLGGEQYPEDSAGTPSLGAESPEEIPRASIRGTTSPHATDASLLAPRLRIALALFVLTFLSATVVHLSLMLQPESLRELVDRIRSNPAHLRPALIYSLALMGILMVHELGHSLTSLACRVQQSYPYFIPFPAVIGTLGSVVFLRSQPPNRSALLRMAIAGPLAGLLAAIPIAAYGLTLSTPLDVSELEGGSKWLGNSLLFVGLANVFSPNGIEVQLHPLAFAGWVAMFVTSLNLIPAAQLDGGHLVHALFGRASILVSFASVLGLFAYGVYLTLEPSQGAFAGAPWLIWATLLFIAGFGHPKVQDPKQRLKKTEWLAGIVTFALLAATFVPVPIQIIPDDPSEAAFLEEEPKVERDWGVDETDYPPESFDL